MRPRVRSGRYSFKHAPASVARIAKNKPRRHERAVATVPLSWLAAQLYPHPPLQCIGQARTYFPADWTLFVAQPV